METERRIYIENYRGKMSGRIAAGAVAEFQQVLNSHGE
jgi:hypothetical protein